MKVLTALVLYVLAFSTVASAQPSPAPQIRYVTADPTGQACSDTAISLLTPNGAIYTCQMGVYAQASGGGSGGGGQTGWTGTTLTIVNGVVQYTPFVGGGTTNGTESVVAIASPAAATIGNLKVVLSAAVGASATFAVTLRDAAADKAVTCTTASGGTTCSDTTHSFSVAQGDLIDWKIVGTGTITAATPQVTIAYTVGTSGVGITNVVTSSPLTGGASTATVTLACATCGVTGTGLQQFAATTSAQLAGVISDETGSGPLAFATAPTFTLPVLGVASATSINKVAVTAPATGSTLTIPDGVTLTGCASSCVTAALNIANTFTARQDATGATSTAPMKTGTSLPGTCVVGDLYFKSDATAGQNIYECQSTNTWTQQLNSGGGGGGSVFTGSTATNPAFSATPTFSLADVSVKSPVRVEPGALTANVTSVTFTNKAAGAKFSIAWTQDGTGGRTVSYGASATNTCTVDATASATTTQQFEVAADGSTVNGTGCTSTISALAGPEIAAPGTPASGTWTCWGDSTNHIYSCKENNSATVSNTVVPDAGASNNFLTAISAGGVISKAQPAFTNISGVASNAQIPAVALPTPGATCTFTANSTICIATTTATITVPVPAAGYQFCVMNDDNVSTVITLSAIGSSSRYENTARTAYGTAGTGTFVSSGAVGDAICILGRDSTHYLTVSHSGAWTAN